MAFDDARAALDGVGCPEDGIDVVVVVRVLLELEQSRFHVSQLFPAFLNEDAGDFVHAAFSASQGASCAGMTSGSPNSAAMLQKSMTELTAWPWATMRTHFPARSASFLRRMSSCNPAVSISETCDRFSSSSCVLASASSNLGFRS